MDFGILGPLQALDEGRLLTLGGSKQKALLALLLLHANETLSTERVIDELWGEQPPATAAKTVQMHVSRLRKALAAGAGAAADVVLTRERGYELRLDPERLDANRFERLVADGRRALAEGSAERASAALEEALALWRGRPLADVSYEAFAQAEIARLEDLRVAAIGQLIDAKLALARHDEVVEQLEALVVEHPYRERFRAQLMLALYRCDRQAEALQAYQDARRQMVEELGIEPGERLRELEAAILAQDAGLALVESPGPAETAARSVVVGRDRELAELGAALDQALAGRGRLVLLAGEPGIGKSMLADETMHRARARGARVAVGRCWEAGGAPAYWPWVQALPDLRELLGGVASRESDSGGARFELFVSIASSIRATASERPLAVFLDDLHAADAPSVLLCRFVAEQIADARVLVVGCYRDTEVGPHLAEVLPELDRTATVQRVRLRGLSRQDTARLLELSSGETLPDALAAKVHSETEGNPLFAGEVGRLLAAEGVVSQAGRLPMPDGVREAIGRRLARLSDDCRRTLSLASVIGREFEPATLELVSGVAQDELFAALDEAVAARLVGELPEGGTMLRFSHVLVRDVVYDELPPTRRPGLHARVAEALERRYDANLEPHHAELAHHYLLAGSAGSGKALHHAGAAGRRAASQLAYEEAARHYRNALEVLDTHGPQDRRLACDLLLALGEALSRAGSVPDAKDALRRAAAIAEQEGWADKLTLAAINYGGRFGWERASTDPALVPLLMRALAAVGDDDGRSRVRLLGRLAAAMRDDPSRDARVPVAEEALAIAERSGDPATLAYALDGYWAAVEMPGLERQGLERCRRLVSLGRDIGDTEVVFAGHDHRFHLFMQLGDRAAADVEFEALSALADEMRQPAQRWHVSTEHASLALLEGRFEDAERLIEETLARGRLAVSWNAAVSQKLQLFVLRRAQGRLAEVEESMTRSLYEYPTLLRFRCALAHLHGELGHTEPARREMDQLLALDLEHEYLDAEWMFSLVMLADPCAFLGDVAAGDRLHALLAPCEQNYAYAPVEAAFGSVARALGRLAQVAGRPDEAGRHFEAALEIERRMRARPWLAHAQHDYAAMLLAGGGEAGGKRAAGLLDEAISTYRELGMDRWARRAENLRPISAPRPGGPISPDRSPR
ncbi:AfsR/SARP family transcriptional regulator [Capillimicrobium parvum]|uniref:OmpR/PhoB-type domain-containing protein n=1 Tax=Capillimicrobium parvum TaxID=2884022 RepID=A0A9E7BYZ1_9ACTN|nr:AfsR/SARP family transcriptional regulator [Capillimicrobium parvum]UGS34019.1 hypothetical protein DSM104329_00389 [Capillimicrobium parvum]